MHGLESGGTGCKVLLNAPADGRDILDAAEILAILRYYAHGSTSAVPKCQMRLIAEFGCNSGMSVDYMSKKLGHARSMPQLFLAGYPLLRSSAGRNHDDVHLGSGFRSRSARLDSIRIDAFALHEICLRVVRTLIGKSIVL